MYVEAGGLSSFVFSLGDRQKMKQVGVDVNSIEGVDESSQNANQISEGGTSTVVLTLVARGQIVSYDMSSEYLCLARCTAYR